MEFLIQNTLSYHNHCPYCNTETEVCDASISSLLLDSQKRSRFCENEDYDDCPIFLARCLTMRCALC
jgi:hypothetical protein